VVIVITIAELPLKRLAHRLWPNARNITKERARNTESFIVTVTAALNPTKIMQVIASVLTLHTSFCRISDQ
jgi:hypothetical protein